MKRMLIAYYSFSGNTRMLAHEIGDRLGCDIRELVPGKPYSFGHNTAAREVRGEIARGYCPALTQGDAPIEAYDVVLIGSPNWFKSFAPPVLSFLRKHDWRGKTVVPFCTHGGGGLGEIEKRIAEECTAPKKPDNEKKGLLS